MCLWIFFSETKLYGTCLKKPIKSTIKNRNFIVIFILTFILAADNLFKSLCKTLFMPVQKKKKNVDEIFKSSSNWCS